MRLPANIARLGRKLVHWFDYKIVYPLFVWRFDKQFRENPKMRNAFANQLLGWGIQRDEEIKKQRAAQIKLVDPK